VLRYQVSPVWAAGPSKGPIFCPLEEATGYLDRGYSPLTRPLGPKFSYKAFSSSLYYLRCEYNVTQTSETNAVFFYSVTPFASFSTNALIFVDPLVKPEENWKEFPLVSLRLDRRVHINIKPAYCVHINLGQEI
jgi:hypothetical protein